VKKQPTKLIFLRNKFTKTTNFNNTTPFQIKHDYRKSSKRKNKNLNRLITDNRFRKKSGVFVVEGNKKTNALAIWV
jgi:hypothetical protein